MDEIVEQVTKGIEGMQSDLSTTNSRVEVIEKALEEVKKSMVKEPANSLPGAEEEDFNFMRFFQGISLKSKNRRLTKETGALEVDIAEQTRQKSQSSTVDDLGGYLIPTQILEKEFIPLLREKLTLLDLGARFMSDVSGSEIVINSQEQGSTAYVLGEGEEITASELKFGEVSLKPRHIACLNMMSNTLLQNHSVSMKQMVMDDFVRVLALKMESLSLFGTGGKQPIGLFNYPGIGSNPKGTNGGVFTFDDVIELQDTIYDTNYNTDNLKLLAHHRVWSRMKKLKVDHYTGQTTNQAYLQGVPIVTNAKLEENLGMPFKHTNLIPRDISKGSGNNLTQVMMGDWSEFIIALWSEMSFDIANQGDTAFKRNQTWIRCLTTFDSAPREPKAFAKVPDAQG